MSKSYTYQLWISLALGLLVCSCNTTKFLDVDQFLLKKNQLIIKAEENIPNKGLLTYEMETLYKQKPNTNLFLFFPREWFWYKTSEPDDTSGFDNWQRRVLSEPPAIFDEGLCNKTTDAITSYLNNKGYFNCETIYEETLRRKKAWVKYYVYPKKRTYIDSIIYHSADKTIDSILQVIKSESLLKKGEPLDSRLYDLEKERIVSQMRNLGYANFFPNYIAQLTADTSISRYRALVNLEVLVPLEDSIHHALKIGKIVVFPHYTPEQESPAHLTKDTLINDLVFRDEPDTMLYFRSDILLEAIKIHPGRPFRQIDLELTQQELAASGVFKFVRIKQIPSKTDPDLLDILIFLTPNLKLEMGADFEMSFTNRAIAAGNLNLIGLSLRPSIKNRNIFNGAETLITSIRAGIEFNPIANKSRFFNTVDVGFQSDLYFPKFKDYLGFWKLVDDISYNPKKHKPGNNLYNILKNNAVSKISAGFNFTKFIDFYEMGVFNTSFGFEFNQGKQRNYVINNLVAEYFRPQLTDKFIQTAGNLFLLKRLEPRFLVSLLFREINYNFIGKSNIRGENIQAGFKFETAGSELYALNKLYNVIKNNKDAFSINKIPFAQFALLETTLRYNRQFTPKTSFATRLGFGIARPFGNSEVVPYLKQFSVGGPNSIRAWAARGLGPGGFIDSLVRLGKRGNNLNFVNTGDLWLEGNMEYRFNIYWLLNGAFFLDAGNVWTFNNDPETPGAPFFFNNPNRVSENPIKGQYDAFYKQIAIGSGFGLRVDVRYFLLRLDFGIKLRYPYRYDGQNFWNDPKLWFKRMNLNLGLGLPF